MSDKFLENNYVVHVAPLSVIAAGGDMWDGPGGGGTGNFNSDVMSMANADGAVFIAATMVNGTGNASVRICACDDTTPTTTVAVSFRYMAIQAPNTILATGEATSYLTSTAADIVYVFEVDAAKIAEQGYEYVYFNSDEVTNAAVEGSVVGFLTGLRYKEDDIGTQVT